jgi:hypothetical protein
LDKEERVGWEEIARVLDGKPRPERNLFEKEEEIPLWASVNLRAIRVERLRHFGDVYLGLALWKRLGLEDFATGHLPSGREEVAWSLIAYSADSGPLIPREVRPAVPIESGHLL